MTTRYVTRLLALVFPLFALWSCGGGGGGGTSKPAAPQVNLAFGIKQLQFTWPAVSGATYYRLMENADGASGYAQVGSNITSTAATVSATRDIAVHRHDWGNARYQVEACNSAGCTASSEMNMVDSAVKAIGYVKASNTRTGDYFGGAVALSADGNTLAISAGGKQYPNSLPSTLPGAIHVFTRTSGLWSHQAYLQAPNGEADDFFGGDLALSGDGNTLVVGAPGEDGNGTGGQGDNSILQSGAAYVYSRSSQSWSGPIYLKAPNPVSDGGFGYAVALNHMGDVLAVGSYSGAYVFTRAGDLTWGVPASVQPTIIDVGDDFGTAVALSSDGLTLAVGACGEDSLVIDDPNNNGGERAGAAYVFAFQEGAWNQQAYVKASDISARDSFGVSVGLSGDGNALAVGAPYEDGSAIGINGVPDDSASGAGAVYLYTRTGSTWSSNPVYVKASNTGASDQFGFSLVLAEDGNTLVVGAVGEASGARGLFGDQTDDSFQGAGATYVYTRDSEGTWGSPLYVKSANTQLGAFGNSAALSGDGTTLAVGAFVEESGATVVCATGSAICAAAQDDNSTPYAGAVYLY